MIPSCFTTSSGVDAACDDAAAGLDGFDQGLGLVSGVALGQIQQGGERVEPGGELYPDLAHGVADILIHDHQPALDADPPDHENGDQSANYDERHKNSPLQSSRRMRTGASALSRIKMTSCIVVLDYSSFSRYSSMTPLNSLHASTISSSCSCVSASSLSSCSPYFVIASAIEFM